MGCDIHMIMEVQEPDGSWRGPERQTPASWWFSEILDDLRKTIPEGHEFDGDHDKLRDIFEAMKEEEILVKYGDDPRVRYDREFTSKYEYSGRNYGLFAVLADVRGDGNPVIVPQRGSPSVCSPECMIFLHQEMHPSDQHSHSWVTLQEMQDYYATHARRDNEHRWQVTFKLIMDAMVTFGYPADKTRLVFFFDN